VRVEVDVPFRIAANCRDVMNSRARGHDRMSPALQRANWHPICGTSPRLGQFPMKVRGFSVLPKLRHRGAVSRSC
jgi:hypothetical protein